MTRPQIEVLLSQLNPPDDAPADEPRLIGGIGPVSAPTTTGYSATLAGIWLATRDAKHYSSTFHVNAKDSALDIMSKAEDAREALRAAMANTAMALLAEAETMR